MRCLALASAMQGDVTFFIDPSPFWESMFKAAGHQVLIEPVPRAAAVLRQMTPAMDAYLFDGYWFESTITEVAGLAFVAQIMDMPGKSVANFVLAPALGSEDWGFDDDKCAVGARFALLRPEFAGAHDAAMRQAGASAVGHLLISFGGRDSSNLSGLALDAIAQSAIRPRVTVVAGADAPHRGDLERRAEEIGAAILTDVEDMAALYLTADLAVGGGGVSLLERCCCGLPSLIIVQANNQIPNASTAQALGVSRVLGLDGPPDLTSIVRAIELLSGDADLRSDMRQRGLQLIDGRGAERAALRLQQSAHRHVNSLSL